MLDWECEAASAEWRPVIDFMKASGEAALLSIYRDRWDELAEASTR